MWIRYPLLRPLTLLLGMLLLGVVLRWAEKKQATQTCQSVEIFIEKNGGHPFIDRRALLVAFDRLKDQPLTEQFLDQLPIKKIEKTIKSHKFVKDSVVYHNGRGKLQINIQPRKPLARLLYKEQVGQYIDAAGHCLPLSPHYTARVLLIDATHWPRGDNAALVTLLQYIDQDPFLRAQITYIQLTETGEVTMRTQIGRQLILLGKPENIAQKMHKLKLFYQKIIPYKGWQAYKEVNLAFHNQIICE